jgi:hypothetical protein
MAMLGSVGIYIGFEEGKAEGVGQSGTSLASTDESTRRQNPEQEHRVYRC